MILLANDSRLPHCCQHILSGCRSNDNLNWPLHSCFCRHLVVARVNGGLWVALTRRNMGSKSPASNPTVGGEDHSFHTRENCINTKKKQMSRDSFKSNRCNETRLRHNMTSVPNLSSNITSTLLH